MTFSASSEDSLTITVRGMDTATYPTIYDDLNNLRGNYLIRVTGKNEYNVKSGTTSTSSWRWLYVRGCKIEYPATYTSKSVAMNGLANIYHPLVQSLTMTYQFSTADTDLK